MTKDQQILDIESPRQRTVRHGIIDTASLAVAVALMGLIIHFSLIPLAEMTTDGSFSDNTPMLIYYSLVIILSILLLFGFIITLAKVIKAARGKDEMLEEPLLTHAD
ncbi:hypothetical protein GCM10009720_21230 [Yaniella flava]|uniref:Uncharacterized protein n=1 Tax=Yaniella flava TaxID=287930 RepID=A0ABP5G5D4_9MICC